jgi:hypothetical protein
MNEIEVFEVFGLEFWERRKAGLGLEELITVLQRVSIPTRLQSSL